MKPEVSFSPYNVNFINCLSRAAILKIKCLASIFDHKNNFNLSILSKNAINSFLEGLTHENAFNLSKRWANNNACFGLTNGTVYNNSIDLDPLKSIVLKTIQILLET